jgi:ornithine carbamoyltransferase
MSVRHFTDLSAVSAGDLRIMLDDAVARKTRLKAGERSKPLDGKVLAMIFDKPSTRTRVSFDVGMRQLGGAARPLGNNRRHGESAVALCRRHHDPHHLA